MVRQGLGFESEGGFEWYGIEETVCDEGGADELIIVEEGKIICEVAEECEVVRVYV